MSPMHNYLYDKCDIILSKTDGFTMFSMRMSVWQQSVLSDVISYCGCVRLAQHISLKITLKRWYHLIGSVYY